MTHGDGQGWCVVVGCVVVERIILHGASLGGVMGNERYICLVPSISEGGRAWSIWYDAQLMEITHGMGSDPTVWPPYSSYKPERWRTNCWTPWFLPHVITAYEMVMEMQTGKIPTPPPPPWYKATGAEDKRYENAD